jgi:fumarylpyruvate hydrolase
MNPLTIPASSLHPRSIFCIGKNYPDHALEMAAWEVPSGSTAQSDRHQEEPIVFMKPGLALSPDGHTAIPRFNGVPIGASLHYEAELVLLIGRDADRVILEDAPEYISGFGAGLDMTLRDVQLDATRAGNPWLKSKGFQNSALVSDCIPPLSAGAWSDLLISLTIDGRQMQHSHVSKMTFSPAYLVHYLSYIYGLGKGDLIFTGTPSGVGPFFPGNRLIVSLETGEGDNTRKSTLVSLEATVS